MCPYYREEEVEDTEADLQEGEVIAIVPKGEAVIVQEIAEVAVDQGGEVEVAVVLIVQEVGLLTALVEEDVAQVLARTLKKINLDQEVNPCLKRRKQLKI